MGPAAEAMALLSFEGVSKRYRQGRRDVLVLDDVWLELDEDDFVGVWGARRAGKSTLLRLAAGIEPPDAGRVRFGGRDLASLSGRERARTLRREIGYVSTAFEMAHAWQAGRGERVVDYVTIPLIGDGWEPRRAATEARRRLSGLGVGDVADARASELSAGERICAALARALVRDPRLLIVDEPAIPPSPEERDSIRELLRGLSERPGLTLVVASEDVGSLRGAGRVLSVGDGRVLSSERAGQVVAFPGEQSVRRKSS
jgi:ABC-type methionine transport system ATPase subunit